MVVFGDTESYLENYFSVFRGRGFIPILYFVLMYEMLFSQYNFITVKAIYNIKII